MFHLYIVLKICLICVLPKAQETNFDICCLLNTLTDAIVSSVIYDGVGSLYPCQNKTKQNKNSAGFRTQFKPE